MSATLDKLRSLPRKFGRITTKGAYRPEIDGLRFIAIAFVLLGHLVERVARSMAIVHPATKPVGLKWIAALPEGNTGVYLFFGISAYILGSQFQRQRERGEPFSYRRFISRRCQRLVPPYATVLLAALAIAAVGYRPELVSPKGSNAIPLLPSFLSTLFYVHGLIFGDLPRLFPPGWSLEPEVHFYLVAPFLFALLFRRSGSTDVVAGLLMVLLAAAISSLGLHFATSKIFFFSLPRFLPFFAIGILAAELFPRRIAPTGPAAAFAWDALGIASFAALVGTGLVHSVASQRGEIIVTDLARICAVLGLLGGAVRGRLVHRILSVRWFAFLGGISYSLYLTNIQVMQVLTPIVTRLAGPHDMASAFVIVTAASTPFVLVAGFVFYAMIERTFMDPQAFARIRAGFRAAANGAPRRAGREV